MDRNDPSPEMPDPYDRAMSALRDRPDVVSARPATVQTFAPVLGTSQTFVVRTFRQRDLAADGDRPAKSRDTIFLEAFGRDGGVRLVIPPAVADAIARQRDALTAKARSRGARAATATRKAKGVVPFAKKVAP